MIRELLDGEHPVSLYIHIPFCARRCDYCAFYSLGKGQWDGELVERFFQTLSSQLDALCDDIARPFETIYIGGGNPVLLGVERLCSLIDRAQRLGKAGEISVEVNPENVTAALSPLMDRVTRVSVGIQSFNDESLRTLGRESTSRKAHEALERLCAFRKEKGVVINADLMTNIPHQSLECALEDVDILAGYGPEHISLYSLTFEEGTALVGREVPKSEEEEAGQLTAIWDRLGEKGYEQYEVSAFARSSHYCRHNLVYWNLGQYIGLGPSAESSVGWSTVVSSREQDSLEGYLSRPSFDSVILSRTETMEEVVMTALRTKWGIGKAAFEERFGTPFDSIFAAAIQRLEKSWYTDSSERFSLTREGLMLLNQVILSFFLAL